MQAVYPQNQHVRYKKQLLYMHSFHLSPVFQGVSWIHKAQETPAANPCLSPLLGLCVIHTSTDQAVSAWPVPVLQALSNQLGVNESVCRVVYIRSSLCP